MRCQAQRTIFSAKPWAATMRRTSCQPPGQVQAILVHVPRLWQQWTRTVVVDVRCDLKLARPEPPTPPAPPRTHLHELTRQLGAVLGHLLGFGLSSTSNRSSASSLSNHSIMSSRAGNRMRHRSRFFSMDSVRLWPPITVPLTANKTAGGSALASKPARTCSEMAMRRRPLFGMAKNVLGAATSTSDPPTPVQHQWCVAPPCSGSTKTPCNCSNTKNVSPPQPSEQQAMRATPSQRRSIG